MSEKIHVSVVVPAHNEEKYVKRCIDSIRESANKFKGNVEIIIVCNRCTDKTEQIALENGAVVVHNEERCIAKVRNSGIKAARGKIIITIDCDNRMTKGTISEIYHLLKSGKYIGGGAPIRFERYSFPLWCNDLLCRFLFGITGLYSGIFWATKETFMAKRQWKTWQRQKSLKNTVSQKARSIQPYARIILLILHVNTMI